MSTEIFRGDYTARDAESSKTQMIAELERRFPTIEFDFVDGSSSVENILMTPSFFASDAMHLYVDAAYSEAFMDTLVSMQAAVSKAKFEKYPVSRTEAALGELQYNYTKSIPADPGSIVWARGSILSTPQASAAWTCVSPQTLVLAGGTFSAYQGSFVTDSYTASSGIPDQYFILARVGIAGNVSVKVTVSSVEWAQVDSVARAGAINSFEVEWKGDFLRIRMGDGVNGNIPTGTVEIEYFITSGEAGSSDIGALAGDFIQSSITIDYTNAAAAEGSDGETVDDLKRKVPGYARAQSKLVADDDYKEYLEEYPGILYADLEYDRSMGIKIFYVMGDSYSAVSDTLKDALTEEMRGKNQEHTLHRFKAVTEVGAIVDATVVLKSLVGRGAIEAKRQEIYTEIQSFFYPVPRDDIYTNTVGRYVRLSDFYRVVERVQNVDHVELKYFTRQPELISKNWDTGVDDIELSTWSVSALQYAALTPSSSFSGLDPSADQPPSSGVIYTIKMSSARRKWGAWPTSGAMALTLEQAFKRKASLTAHFEVTAQLLDGSSSTESVSSYLGVETVAGSGFFSFVLDATKSAILISNSVPELVDGYSVLYFHQGRIVVGSVNISVLSNLGASYALTDSSDGGLYDNNGALAGYLDYDTGRILITAFTAASVIGTADVYSFANDSSQTAEIVVAAPISDIPVRRHEFCGIDTLSLKVRT